ncbi:hypothetical protein EBX31_04110 [bacterium]|nr:hypothetical protein [bacterium]
MDFALPPFFRKSGNFHQNVTWNIPDSPFMILRMPRFPSFDTELENALLALGSATGRSREELLRDMILKELHLTSISEGNTPPKKSPNVPSGRRSNLV